MHSFVQLIAAITGDLNQPAHYLKWGFIQVSIGNLVAIHDPGLRASPSPTVPEG